MGPSRRAIQRNGDRHNDVLDSADFLRHPNDTFECRICPMRKGKARVMKEHNAREHVRSGVHQRFSKAASRGTRRMPSLVGPTASDVMGEVWQSLSATSMAAGSGASTSSAPDTTYSQPLVSDANHISDLLDAAGGSHIDSGISSGSAPYIADPTPSIPNVNHPSADTPTDDEDHFHIDSVDQTLPLTEPWVHFTPDGDCPIGDNEHVDDLNVDLDAIAFLDDPPPAPSGMVSTTCPTYPWPSVGMFLTDILFSSPRLRFSEAQKKAVLSWALQLGARDVPTYHALSQFQERLRNTVGNSVTAVTTGAGHKVYMQDIPYMIAKDYANPITRFAIWDYPIDGEGCASQVFHGSKMLVDMPSNLVVPTVCVKGRIFFADELLQTFDGTYFIPNNFFYRLPRGAKLSGIPTATGLGGSSNGSQVYEPSVHDLWSLGHKVVRTDTGFIVSDEKVAVRVDTFQRTFLDIQSDKREFQCGFTDTSRKYGSRMPHPLRVKADGRMVYTVPVIIFMDDASANISKQWNKHIVVYLSNAGLPREMLDKEFCTKFVMSSPNASPMELMRAVRDSIDKALDSPVATFDCKTGKEILIIPYLIFTASDNPMHAEQTSHAGLCANHFCRTCDVGGTKAYKKSNEGFAKIFEIGRIRDPDETKGAIEKQLELCVLPGGSDKVESASRSCGIKDALVAPIISCITAKGKSLRSRKSPNNADTTQNGTTGATTQDFLDAANIDVLDPGDEDQETATSDVTQMVASVPLSEDAQKLSEHEIHKKLSEELGVLLKQQGMNPLIGMPGFDMHRDTPTEILHTVLLGVVKYFWAQTMWYLKNRSKSTSLFQTRLASTDWKGLNAPSTNAEYICQYHGSLIGKHFKSLAQVMPFLIYDLVPQDVLHAWNIIGKLVVLLWHTKIDDVEDYLVSLSQTIQNFLNITAKCSPGILVSKPKFHFLVHLPMFIRRFGPAILFSTERYESFNHIFRLSCIFSNRQAPSRDSCNAFAAQDRIKHIATGGYWHDPQTRKWAHAGQKILEFISMNTEYLGWLGLPKESEQKPGEIKLFHKKEWSGRRAQALYIPLPPVPWKDTKTSKVLPPDFDTPTEMTNNSFHQAESFVARNGNDRVHLQDFVVFRHATESHSESEPKLRIGRVTEILAIAVDNWQATRRCTPHNPTAHVTLEAYSFDKEQHKAWEVPCIQPSEEGVIVVTAKEIYCIVNVQHDCYSCKCSGIQHHAVRQEREKTSRTRAMIDHKPEARFVLNTHSIHNYETILAVTPPDLLVPSFGVGSDTVAIRTKAAQLLRGEDTTNDPLSIDVDAPISESLPFDRTHAKTRAAHTNTNFTGTLSSQSKSVLMEMAAALSIPTTEKARKQELVLKIRDYLDTNPEVRNGVRFAQVTWRSANRNKTTSIPSSHGAAIPPSHQQVSFHVPSHSPCPPLPVSQTHDSMPAGLPAGHPTPSTSSLHTLQGSFLYFPPPATPAPYVSPQIPPTNGLHHNLHGGVPLPNIPPYTHTSYFAPVHQGNYPRAPYDFYRDVE